MVLIGKGEIDSVRFRTPETICQLPFYNTTTDSRIRSGTFSDQKINPSLSTEVTVNHQELKRSRSLTEIIILNFLLNKINILDSHNGSMQTSIRKMGSGPDL